MTVAELGMVVCRAQAQGPFSVREGRGGGDKLPGKAAWRITVSPVTGCRVSAPRTLVIIGDLTLSAAAALGLEP